MKRILAVLLTICIIFVCGACGTQLEPAESTPTPAAATPVPEGTDVVSATPVEQPKESAAPSAASQPEKPEEKPAAQASTPKPVATQTPSSTPVPPPEKKADAVTISIDCHTALANYDKLDSALKDERFVPSSGVILANTTVEVTGGESVYDILQKVCKQNKILVECSYAPGTKAAYVEGINNLYEFSCGSLSGWVYSVNDVFPSESCSQYQVSPGDVIRWRYTCDLGRDVKGE